jgi:hypothetical protein
MITSCDVGSTSLFKAGSANKPMVAQRELTRFAGRAPVGLFGKEGPLPETEYEHSDRFSDLQLCAQSQGRIN